MVPMEVERSAQQASSTPDNNNTISSPRISFSCDLDDDSNASNFISIDLSRIKTDDNNEKQSNIHSQNFEFLSDITKTQRDMPSADELFFDGKLLPYWQTHHSEKIRSLKLNSEEIEKAVVAPPAEAVVVNADVKEESTVIRTWFIDDDPSPRPPKCTVLWKELLRLKSRQKGSTLSPSSSSLSSLDMSKEKDKEKDSNGAKNVKRVKKGLERTRSASIRIRPMVNVPICTQHVRQSSSGSTLPPLFPIRRGRPTF